MAKGEQAAAAGEEPRGAPDDAELAALAARAPAELPAFRELVVRTQNELVRYAARLLGSVPEAEDVVQEAYVKAYSALQRARFDGRSRVRTWLYSIVTHTAIDTLRSSRRRRSLAERAHAESAPEPAGMPSAEARLALAELGRALERLTPEQRTVLVLKSIEGHSSREIAEILNCSEGAVEQRLLRARAALATLEQEP
ncbi:MAG TPA: RNA polymerase sigma factor [Polyangiaceae bacterium]|nr:RNA polymerase sigma factor [Polyangiaceae bacterium]